MVHDRAAKLLELAEEYDRQGRAYVAAKLRVAAQEAQLDYDAEDDFSRSIDEAYAVIRERKANGGPGWTPP